jgi:hypothetical protein
MPDVLTAMIGHPPSSSPLFKNNLLEAGLGRDGGMSINQEVFNVTARSENRGGKIAGRARARKLPVYTRKGSALVPPFETPDTSFIIS